MSSAVNDLQRAIVDGQQSLIQLLRHTKLIAAKLNLSDIEKWVDLELNGYAPLDAETAIPDYRCIRAYSLAIHNPYRGWQYAGDVQRSVEVWQPIAEIEELSRQEECFSTPNEKFTITDSLGTTSKSQWPQLSFCG